MIGNAENHLVFSIDHNKKETKNGDSCTYIENMIPEEFIDMVSADGGGIYG